MKAESEQKPARNVTGLTLPTPATEEGDRLESWKEIAAFLGRTERTVMRYEDLGMPVHRLPGAKRSRVTAYRSELKKWLATEHRDDAPAQPSQVPDPEPKRSNRRYAIAGVLVAIFAIATIGVVLSRTQNPRLPSDAKLTAEALTALDSDGHALWRYAFQRKLNLSIPGLPGQLARVADLMGDGDREVLAVVPFAIGPNPGDGTECEIACFSSRGKRLWSYLPHETFRFGTHELHGPWFSGGLILSARQTGKAIFVVFIHSIWGNSFVAEVDPKTGAGTVRYVNTGTIRTLSEVKTSRATYLIAAGFNNEYDGGSAALIDERKSFAASPQTKGTRHKCASCPEGAPDYYFVFPRSEGNRLRKEYENPVEGLQATGNEVLFQKYEGIRNSVNDGLYLVGLEPVVHPISLRFGSSYDMEHREWERTGEAHHTLAQCLERLHPSPVRMWTPAAGWTELNFAPSGFDQ